MKSEPASTSSTASNGYSGTPLAQKLGIKAGSSVHVMNPPSNYAALLAPLPAGAAIDTATAKAADIVHCFVRERAVLAKELKHLRKQMRTHAALWISWPKKSSCEATDITEDIIRVEALPLGWVDIKVCAVDAVWSGLKLVVRKELR